MSIRDSCTALLVRYGAAFRGRAQAENPDPADEYALRGTERDTGIDPEGLQKLSDYWSDIRAVSYTHLTLPRARSCGSGSPAAGRCWGAA